MRNILLILILTAFTNSTPKIKKKIVYLTVIEHDNQNPGYEFKTQTIIQSKPIDLNKTVIDTYFSWKNFKTPYQMPTETIYKDSIKETECDSSKYPSTVKCYEYDDKNRVIKMKVEGSGTTGTYEFIYDNNDRIIEITNSLSRDYKMSYNKVGNLTKISSESGDLKKELEFIYSSRK